jgi:all-trans-retinol 13,14-reductase
LSKQGQKVLVLERHYTAGGFTHVFKRKGLEWDVGIHYIGEVQRPNSILRKLFDYITNHQLKWADMGKVYDRIVIGDQSFDFVKGVANFKAQLIAYFPDEEQAIHQYVDLVFKAVGASKNYYISKALSPVYTILFGRFLKQPFLKYSDRTTDEVLRSLTQNDNLIKVLTGQYGDYGLPPKQSSFSMHASVVRHYFDGGSFPIGGSSQIVKTIAPVIAHSGGTILVSAEVDQILIKNNTAYGVQMKDGHTVLAKTIISNAGVMTTYNSLIPQSIVNTHKLKDKLKTVKKSVAHVSLYIGLDGSPEVLNLPKTNYWIYPESGDHDNVWPII